MISRLLLLWSLRTGFSAPWLASRENRQVFADTHYTMVVGILTFKRLIYKSHFIDATRYLEVKIISNALSNNSLLLKKA